MPNFGTLVLGPPEFRRFSAEIRFAEYCEVASPGLSGSDAFDHPANMHIFSKKGTEY